MTTKQPLVPNHAGATVAGSIDTTPPAPQEPREAPRMADRAQELVKAMNATLDALERY
jgi:HAMP domain-containing protein